jgi:hypothetical protein
LEDWSLSGEMAKKSKGSNDGFVNVIVEAKLLRLEEI